MISSACPRASCISARCLEQAASLLAGAVGLVEGLADLLLPSSMILWIGPNANRFST